MDFSLCHFWNLKLRIYPTLWFCVIFLLSIIFWVKPEIFNLRYEWRWPKYITLVSFYSSSTSAPPLLMASLRLSASDLSFALFGRILEASSNSIRAATMFPIFKEWIGMWQWGWLRVYLLESESPSSPNCRPCLSVSINLGSTRWNIMSLDFDHYMKTTHFRLKEPQSNFRVLQSLLPLFEADLNSRLLTPKGGAFREKPQPLREAIL